MDSRLADVHVPRVQHMPGTAREVSRFLKVFSATENHRFAVIKIGGAVVEENLDELAKQLAFLARVGLCG
jgi:acetylglutamate kinase